MSRCAAAGGFYSARRAWSYTSALSRKCLPPREGLRARLGFGGHGFSRTGRCRCVPCAQQRDRQCRAGSCTGGWQGLAITQAVPRNQPLLEGWDETLQKGPFPLAGGTLPCSSAPRAGRGEGSPRTVGARARGGTQAPYPATKACEKRGENLFLAAAGAGEQQLCAPGLPHPLRTAPGPECGRARGVRGAGAHPGARGSAAGDSPCSSRSGVVLLPAETRQISPGAGPGEAAAALERGRRCSRAPVPALGAHAALPLGQHRPGPP